MKRRVLLIFSLVLSFAFTTMAQDKAEQEKMQFRFQTSAWKKIQQSAKIENRIIFIQFMTENCPPCDQFKKEIWTDQSLAEEYSQHFLLFLPKEGQKDTKTLVKKYHINSYPTSIFIDGKGNLIHKIQGFISKKEMHLLVDDVVNNVNTLSYYAKMYKSQGESMESQQLFNYAVALMNAGDDYETMAQQYFKTQPQDELYTARNLKTIMLFTEDMYSPEFNYLVRHKEEFESKEYSLNQIDMKIEDVIANSLITTMMTSKNMRLEDTLSITLDYFQIRNQEAIRSRVEMDYADFVKPNKQKYFQALDRYMASHLQYLPTGTIVDKANRVLSESNDKMVINSAMMWVNEAMIRTEFADEELYDVYINLLLKDNRFQEAHDVFNILHEKWMESGLSDDEINKKSMEYTKKIEKATEQAAESGGGLSPNR